jgi:hypothetical protein
MDAISEFDDVHSGAQSSNYNHCDIYCDTCYQKCIPSSCSCHVVGPMIFILLSAGIVLLIIYDMYPELLMNLTST